MECKIKVLFISLALGLLLGCLSKVELCASETEETPFGTLAETVSFYDYILDLEEASFSKHDIISEINEGDALRHFPQTKRINSSSSSKEGLAFIKRNQILYAPPITLESCRRFPSKLTDSKQHLISFGRLII